MRQHRNNLSGSETETTKRNVLAPRRYTAEAGIREGLDEVLAFRTRISLWWAQGEGGNFSIAFAN